MQRISAAIIEILKRVSPGGIFDSHFVITALITDPPEGHENTYLRYAADFGPKVAINVVHAKISAMIGECGVTRVADGNGHPEEAFSYNIHGEVGPCACWRKGPQPA